MENKEPKNSQPEFTPEYIDRLFSGTDSKPQPPEPVVAPPVAEEQPQPPRKKKPSKLRRKLRRHKKALSYIAAALAVAAVCLLVWLLRDPFADIPQEQWEILCRDAYDRLCQVDQLHFTKTQTDRTEEKTQSEASEVWFSGEDSYRLDTRETGEKRAFLTKAGTHYQNTHHDLAQSQWTIDGAAQVFTRRSESWSSMRYTLQRLDRKGQRMEVVFSRDGGLVVLGTNLKMHYLTFRFDRKLNLEAIVYDIVIYKGKEPDPDQIKSVHTEAYTLHDTSKTEIEEIIASPFQAMAKHLEEKSRWDGVCAELLTQLCSESVLHYTYKETIKRENDADTVTNCDGWICGTDSVIHRKVSRNKVTETIELRKNDCSYRKSSKAEEEANWQLRTIEPSMHYLFGKEWKPNTHTFFGVETSANGTDLTVYRSQSQPNSGSINHGIWIITFHLDRQQRLTGLTVEEVSERGDAWAPNWFNAEPDTVTEYKFHDTTEEKAQNQIERYYQMATAES